MTSRTLFSEGELRLMRRLEQLFADECDETALVDIEALIEKEPKLRYFYVEYVSLHSFLRRRYIAPPGGEELAADDFESQSSLGLREDSVSTRRRAKRQWLTGAGVLAATLLLMTSILASGSWRQSLQSVSSEEGDAVVDYDDSAQGVAVLSQLVDVQWESRDDPPVKGRPVPPRQLDINEGLLRLEFYSGAVVVLEGPASFELLSANEGQIHHGKIRVRVPPQARGFTIRTSLGNVVDLGTEFALDIPQEGDPELHVLDGEVEFLANNSATQIPTRLIGGQAIPLDAVSLDQILPSEASRFVGAQELAAISKSRRRERLAVMLAQRERMQEDPSMVAHYVFSNAPEWSRTLANEAPGAAASTDGTIIGCRWVSGRWPGHRALRFSSASHRVRVHIPGEYDSLTMATWIYIEELRVGQNIAIMHPEIDQDRIVHWTLDRIDGGALLHFADTVAPTTEATNRRHYSSILQGLGESEVNQWIHLAVVYDPQAGMVSHYRDGRIVGAMAIATPRPVSIGTADLGNWPYKDWAKGTKFETRNLCGRMDEFLILGRAASAEEVWQMYEVGAP